MEKKKKNRYIYIGIVALFILTLYWVEFSPWGSNALAQYNGGYGTFDMKFYDAKIVYEILENTKPIGFNIYNKYLLGDYIFIFAFGALQLIITLNVYKKYAQNKFILLIMMLPIWRGMFDFVENTMLEFIINVYPKQLYTLVNVASTATQAKKLMILLWIISIIVGFCLRFYNIKNIK